MPCMARFGKKRGESVVSFGNGFPKAEAMRVVWRAIIHCKTSKRRSLFVNGRVEKENDFGFQVSDFEPKKQKARTL